MTQKEKELLELTRARRALEQAVCHLLKIGRPALVARMFAKLETVASEIDSIMEGKTAE
jgi:hypothetical protein